MKVVKQNICKISVRKKGLSKESDFHTLIADTKQSTLLCVTTETNQHLIGCATRWVIRLSIGEHSQFPGCLLWTIPEGKKRSWVNYHFK